MAAWFEIRRYRRSDCKGAASLEFALLLPALLMILFGTIEYGWYLTWQFVLNNAVAEGARVGVTAREWDDEDPIEMARAAVKRAFWLAGDEEEDQEAPLEEALIITITESEDDDQLRTLEVAVDEWIYRPITGFLPEALIPASIGAKSVMAFPR